MFVRKVFRRGVTWWAWLSLWARECIFAKSITSISIGRCCGSAQDGGVQPGRHEAGLLCAAEPGSC